MAYNSQQSMTYFLQFDLYYIHIQIFLTINGTICFTKSHLKFIILKYICPWNSIRRDRGVKTSASRHYVQS